MNRISLVLLQFLSIVAAKLSFIWVIVEFIIYLVKDKPFNWLSIWLFITSGIISFALSIFLPIGKVKPTNIQTKVRKSKFHERLELMQQQRQNIK